MVETETDERLRANTIEVPLSEQREAYLLRIRKEGLVRREVELRSSEFLYDWSMQLVDQIGESWHVEVAQLSDSFGVGPFRTLVVS